MPNIRVQSAEEVERSFAPPPRRALREETMRPYRDAVAQLGPERPGGLIELEEGENPREVMTRLHQAAHDAGLYLRFQRRGRTTDQRELRFRLQTPEETTRLKERGAVLAQARQARRQSEQPKQTGRRRAS